MNIAHFTDSRIAEIHEGTLSMTPEERAFLIASTPGFEECDRSADDLAAMSDAELMRAAYGVWADFASCL